MYIKSPKLHAKTILKHIIELFPECNYRMSQLRTLERRLHPLRILHGGNKEIYFPQKLRPGIQRQSDWTHMESLNVTICGEHFKHLVFHFMLPYSRWERVDICYSESFDSLANGYQKALSELRGAPRQHKTDNSSTATKKAQKGRNYTTRYSNLLDHYGVTAKKNNPGKGNENGSVEKSHDLFKVAVDQALFIRGSREFTSIEDYREFLEVVVSKRNLETVDKLLEEVALLIRLPLKPYEYRELMEARVNKFGLIRIHGCSYSLPSKYVGSKLDVIINSKTISLYFEAYLVAELPKLAGSKVQVNYRHIIDSLIKKPGAFEQYKYREYLYHQPVYKQCYELLEQKSKNYVKEYLQLLHLSKNYGEELVSGLIKQHLSAGRLTQAIGSGHLQKEAVLVAQPPIPGIGNTLITTRLEKYDTLLQGAGRWN